MHVITVSNQMIKQQKNKKMFKDIKGTKLSIFADDTIFLV